MSIEGEREDHLEDDRSSQLLLGEEHLPLVIEMLKRAILLPRA
jgi:hypothetical protein